MNNDCTCKNNTSFQVETPINCGCRTKQDLLCTYYSGSKLDTTGVVPGDDGNTVIRKIDEAISLLPTDEEDTTSIESTGGKVDIYTGISAAYIHQIRSIQGVEGVIVEPLAQQNSCEEGSYINVRIDKEWLKNHVLHLLTQEFNICNIISGCGTVPIPNDAPVTEDFSFTIPNRSTRIFTGTDFPFFDTNGDAFSAVMILGAVEDYQYNNLPYVSGTEVSVSDIQQGKFKFVGKDTDLLYNSTAQFKVKDSQNNWSTAKVITIEVTAKVKVELSTVDISVLRGQSNTQTATVNYTNGTGLQLTAGQELYSIGAVGQPGYIKVYVQSDAVLTSVGSFGIVVVTYPYNTVGGNPTQVSYTLPQNFGTGVINITYMSAPENENVNLSTEYMQDITFSPSTLTAHMSDLDNDEYQVKVEATPDNLAGYKYNGTPYTGQWINISDLGNLTFSPENIPAGYPKSNRWRVKDSKGNESTI